MWMFHGKYETLSDAKNAQRRFNKYYPGVRTKVDKRNLYGQIDYLLWFYME